MACANSAKKWNRCLQKKLREITNDKIVNIGIEMEYSTADITRYSQSCYQGSAVTIDGLRQMFSDWENREGGSPLQKMEKINKIFSNLGLKSLLFAAEEMAEFGGDGKSFTIGDSKPSIGTNTDAERCIGGSSSHKSIRDYQQYVLPCLPNDDNNMTFAKVVCWCYSKQYDIPNVKRAGTHATWQDLMADASYLVLKHKDFLKEATTITQCQRAIRAYANMESACDTSVIQQGMDFLSEYFKQYWEDFVTVSFDYNTNLAAQELDSIKQVYRDDYDRCNEALKSGQRRLLLLQAQTLSNGTILKSCLKILFNTGLIKENIPFVSRMETLWQSFIVL